MWLLLLHGHLARDAFGIEHIIGIEKLDELSARQLEATVAGCTTAPIASTTQRTRSANDSMTPRLPSVDPSSMTMISVSG